MNPRLVIMKVWKYIRGKEESNEEYVNTHDSIYDIMEKDLDSFQRFPLQTNLPHLKRIIVGSIWYDRILCLKLAEALLLGPKKKMQLLEKPQILRPRKVISNRRRLHLYPAYISTLCRGLTESQNRGKHYYTHLCSADQNPKAITV